MTPSRFFSTLKEPSSEANAGDQTRSALVWVPPAGGEQPRVTWLDERIRWRLGRDEQCDVVLAGSLVSRGHAQIARQAGDWVITDLGSSNGVYLNGRLARQGTLRPGDVLRLGEWIALALEFSADEQPEYGEVWPGVFGGPDLRKLRAEVDTACRGDFSVVLEGATGTGKEQLARAIHEQSGAAGPFIAINCAVYSGATAAAELFGYRKGAFTGAERAHPGVLRAAENGTVLLDEVTDLDLSVQAQLLRVLENRELSALGEARPLPLRTRFLAAAQQPLAEAVARGSFRADLRARLEGLVIRLPELQARRGDVPFLFLHLFRALSPGVQRSFEPKVMELLCAYSWPLNVRELVSFVRRLIAAHPDGGLLTRDMLLRTCRELELPALNERPSTLPSATSAPEPESNPGRRSRSERAFEAKDIEALASALKRHDGNVTRAAQELGITRARAYRLLEAQRNRSS